MSPADDSARQAEQTIRIRGKRTPYLERVRIRRRDYFLLEEVGNALRRRYRAFSPDHGPDGAFFLIQRWPRDARAERQLKILSRLKIDSLPRIWDWQPTADGFDIALTWVDGITLADYFRNIRSKHRPAVTAFEALRLTHGLANAVCNLSHTLQLAHRDIQPTNVIITAHSSRLVLIDFGSACTQQMQCDSFDGDGRNRCYAAPEFKTQVTPVGFLADQFSVMVLFYELLTMTMAYDIGGKAGWPEFSAQCRDSFVAPSRRLADRRKLPRSLLDGLDRIASRGLALDPGERYPDRHVWLDDLSELMARFRLSPKPPSIERLLTRVVEWFVIRRRSY